MDDRGLFLTWQAIRRQLAAMPNDLYLVRLIHNPTGRRPFPEERLWTAAQLGPSTIRFLRARNCAGCDVYFHPYAGTKTPAIFWSIWINARAASPTDIPCFQPPHGGQFELFGELPT